MRIFEQTTQNVKEDGGKTILYLENLWEAQLIVDAITEYAKNHPRKQKVKKIVTLLETGMPYGW